MVRSGVVAFLIRLNAVLEKIMPLLTPSAIVIGVLLSTRVSSYEYLVPWIFAGMTFIGSLKSSFGDIGRELYRPWKLLTILLILHVVMPCAGWLSGKLFFPDDPLTAMGCLLLFVLPTGVVSVVWVSIYRGNLALTLSLILIDTLLSPLVVPASLYVLMGQTVEIQVWEMMQGLLWMIVLPSLAGMLVNQWTKGKVNAAWGPSLAPFVKIGMFVVVVINGSVIAPYFRRFDNHLAVVVAVTLGTAVVGYLIGWGVSSLLRWNREDSVAMQFNAGMRNISAGAVIAVQYFPAAVSLPVISGMLFQQLLAALFGYRLARKDARLNKLQSGSLPGAGAAVSDRA
ncbi:MULTISPECIES: bile acid:sodium symporter family protein [Cohnella]|uniref:bile acid:sodium symporter family protein n=1 Tax=Cohnella TaxID=329857 RepID=UPI0009BBABF8|nr:MULTISPECIES: bile acid:sodium symporter family protein [Cohnella]MBN2980866.1 bile acid:sodium symporter family protein [Cohnella algarum]